MYLFLAALGLRCCTWAFSSCVDGLLTEVASLVAEHGLQVYSLSSCGTRAQQLWLMGSRAQAQQLRRMGLVAPWHVRSSWTRARTGVPCIGRQILNHCATREALFFTSLLEYNSLTMVCQFLLYNQHNALLEHSITPTKFLHIPWQSVLTPNPQLIFSLVLCFLEISHMCRHTIQHLL